MDQQFDQTSTAAFAGVFMFFFFFTAILTVFSIAISWRIFSKAGQPGWACLVPIYSAVVCLQIIGRPWYHMFLFLIPFYNIYLTIVCVNDLSKSFGKDTGFTIGLLFLGIVFYPILAFGNATYIGPAGVPVETPENAIQGIGATV